MKWSQFHRRHLQMHFSEWRCTIAVNVMESPTSWLHGCLFRHDFEIIKDASYKSCSRDYSYICRHFVGNKLMWENAAQVRILSLNWWQNPGRVWSHANSAHPPNSHLAPKLKINKAHWNNSLHIGWTWYCLSDPYTSSVRACLLRLEEPWHDETCSRPGSTPFLAELQTTPGGQHCLVQLRTVEGGGQTCSIGFMSGLWAGQSMTSTSCWSKKAAVSHAVWGGALSWTYTMLRPNTPVAHGKFDSSGSGLLLPVHGSIHHDRLTSPPMVDCTPYHDRRDTISIIRLDAGINQ